MNLRVTLLAVALAATGCSYVTAGGGSDANLSGDLWYARTSVVLGMPVDTSIWYCSPPSSGRALCKRARLVVEGDFEPAPSPSTWGEGDAERAQWHTDSAVLLLAPEVRRLCPNAVVISLRVNTTGGVTTDDACVQGVINSRGMRLDPRAEGRTFDLDVRAPRLPPAP